MKVSVITPTANRPEMLERCIQMFIAQDYPYLHKEMIVCNTGGWNSINHENVPTLYTKKIDGQFWVRDQFTSLGVGNYSIGEKRNAAIRRASGDIILHMDDDDIYAPDWITRSVEALISSKAELVGLSNAYFYDKTKELVYQVPRKPDTQLYVCGATMCYWRRFWERKPFEDISAGEDFNFQFNNGKTHCHGYKEGFLATVHGSNTVSHQSLPLMNKVAPQDAGLLLKHFRSFTPDL